MFEGGFERLERGLGRRGFGILGRWFWRRGIEMRMS